MEPGASKPALVIKPVGAAGASDVEDLVTVTTAIVEMVAAGSVTVIVVIAL